MTSTISPTRVPIRRRHLGRNVAMGAAAVALGVAAAFVIEDWTDSTTVDTPSVEVEVDVSETPASPDALDSRTVAAQRAAHVDFCRTTAWAPDAVEACLESTR